MNTYRKVTADEFLKATPDEFQALENELEADCINEHGFELEYGNYGVLLFTPDDGHEDDLPKAFLLQFGLLIAANGMEYLSFGVAYTSDGAQPGTLGGSEFRIYADGSIERPRVVWDRDLKREK